jgi:galactose mutarotase-like enzyme
VVELRAADAATRMTIAPFRGAIVTSLIVHGRELLYLDRATFEDPTKNVRGGIPVLFPSPGKLADDRWARDGLSGAMKQHGFARTKAWSVLANESNTATLQLRSDAETLQQYPWQFDARLELTLEDDRLQIATEVRNEDAKPMPFGLGFHPYFRVVDKSRVRIESRATRAFDNVAKAMRPFTGFDLSADEVDLHLVDHPDDHLDLDFDDGTRIVVRASDAYRRWIVWTLKDREFVCVEPWTASGNALNSGEGLIVLAPGATHRSWVSIGLG